MRSYEGRPLEMRRVHISEVVSRPAPRRPWDLRLRQWLLQRERLYWVLVAIAALATFVTCMRVLP